MSEAQLRVPVDSGLRNCPDLYMGDSVCVSVGIDPKIEDNI